MQANPRTIDALFNSQLSYVVPMRTTALLFVHQEFADMSKGDRLVPVTSIAA